MRVKNFNIAVGAQIYKSCSDEARLRVLNLIIHNTEMCISDLELVLGYTQTKTSRHITYLKNSGILTTRKSDHWVLYSIKDEMKDIINLLHGFIKKDATLKKDVDTFNTMLSNRELAYHKISGSELLQ